MYSGMAPHKHNVMYPVTYINKALSYLNLAAMTDHMADKPWQADAKQVVLVMVGLPARGKSLISGKGKKVYGQVALDNVLTSSQ